MVRELERLLSSCYAPHDNVYFSAIAKMKDGMVFGGVLVKNDIFRSTIYAEEAAIANAVSHGYKKSDFDSLYVMTSSKNLNDLKLQNQNAAKVAKEKLEAARALAKDLEDKSIVVKIQAGVEGKVFGSISSKEIALEAKKQLGLDIDKKKIVIPDAIKSLGTYNVNIKLHKDVVGKLAVKVEAK